MVKISELFTSIQGEGPYVGYKQIFIRLCGCNLNCSYCDTDFDTHNATEYTLDELIEYCNNNIDCHSVSLTGGEPLLHTDFIKSFASRCPLPIYLETNGTLYKQLEEVIDYLSYISADIKLPSCANTPPMWSNHRKFFEIASQKELFAKVVFNYNSNESEVQNVIDICKEFNIEIILQPEMMNDKPVINAIKMQKYYDLYLKKYKKVRLIPQVHKFLNVL